MRWPAVALLFAATTIGCGPKPLYRPAPDLTDTKDTKDAKDASQPRSSTSVDGVRVAEAAQPWMNVPYRFGGTDQRGIDCSALTQHVLGDLGVSLPRSVCAQRLAGASVPTIELRPGDLLFFSLSGGSVDHVGIALDANRFVHASTSRGVVVDYLMDRYFARGFVEARRVLASQ